jgi:hypothetical protein
VAAILSKIDLPAPGRVPVMRFPWSLPEQMDDWRELHARGFNVRFRFPLRETVTSDRWDDLANALLELPVTAILFLKHLEHVEVEVVRPDRTDRVAWRLARQRRVEGAWEPIHGLERSGVYHVRIDVLRPGRPDESSPFLVAHDADVEIGRHRAGLVGYAWEGIEFTEVSVATPWPTGVGEELAAGWPRFHVFLPTGVPSPYPLMINGAFSTDLSRQEIRLGSDPESYNRFLLGRAAVVFRDRLAAELLEGGAPATDILRMLDRSRGGVGGEVGDVLHEVIRRELSNLAFIPSESGPALTIEDCVVPPDSPTLPQLGGDLRTLLPTDAMVGGQTLPAAEMCHADAARVLADLGARQLTPLECVPLLESTDPDRSLAMPHPSLPESAGVRVDPVLEVLEGLLDCPGGRDDGFLKAVHAAAVFPVAVDDGGHVRHIRTADVNRFYPPRSLTDAVPLSGLAFMAATICWGTLSPRQRSEVLGRKLTAWQTLFEMREFKFPPVMQASVLPALDLPTGGEESEARKALHDLDVLAAICQLAGPSPNPGAPLPYERLGSNRALFNLSRLPVPCRPADGGDVRWVPAYRAYLGTDWIADGSVEHVLDAMRAAGSEKIPDIPLVLEPALLVERLAKYSHLADAALEGDDQDSDEVGRDEDEEAILDTDERERWIRFLTWIGVNRVLRMVSFHDVEDRGTGWASTPGMARPDGHAFRGLSVSTWDKWSEQARSIGAKVSPGGGTRYLYEVHDIDYAGIIPAAAKADNRVATALFRHLARNWDVLGRFTNARGAQVPPGKVLGMRSKPIKPYPDEEHDLGENLWLYRLRRVSWLPTTRGPMLPSKAWLPSSEITRRFGRRGANAGNLIPMVLVDDPKLDQRTRAFAAALRIRDDFTPASFGRADGESLLKAIEATYATQVSDGTLTESMLRNVIRPAYTNLFELLSGQVGEDDDGGKVEATLGTSPILVHDGHGHHRFVEARTALYLSRSGTRERLAAQVPIWTIVNEVSISRRKPLQLLGIRVLEAELSWTPDPGVPAFDDESELVGFREGVRSVAPFILARLRADRPDEQLVQRDAGRLRRLLETLEPVRTLSLSCRLDGAVVSEGIARDGFVDVQADGGMVAYVRWGERGWPPSADEAEGLAGILVDTFAAGAFEAFLALIRAEGDETRFRLLRLSGAPVDLDAVWALVERDMQMAGDDLLVDEGRPPVDDTAGDDEPVEGGAGEIPPAPVQVLGRTPLYRLEDLEIAGMPVLLIGAGPHREDGRTGRDQAQPRGGSSQGGSGSGGGAGFGGRTDLTELDHLGMRVSMGFERHRLALAGIKDAITSADPMGTPGRLLVFDVSTAVAAEEAWARSPEFRAAFSFLERHGVHRWHPGFDILTLDPSAEEMPQRLIELKSSGVNARTQTMTWNEWKSAATSSIRDRFYLYLAGNLRTDLTEGRPFIRTIHDPFAALWGQEVQDAGPRRSMQLNVLDFDLAEELILGVRVTEIATAANVVITPPPSDGEPRVNAVAPDGPH